VVSINTDYEGPVRTGKSEEETLLGRVMSAQVKQQKRIDELSHELEQRGKKRDRDIQEIKNQLSDFSGAAEGLQKGLGNIRLIKRLAQGIVGLVATGGGTVAIDYKAHQTEIEERAIHAETLGEENLRKVTEITTHIHTLTRETQSRSGDSERIDELLLELKELRELQEATIPAWKLRRLRQ